MTKILHLTLKKEYFDAIARGEKKVEYRNYNIYWKKRLMEKHIYYRRFDEVWFRNGYSKNSPFMRVEWKGIDIVIDIHSYFVIHLGDVLEINNWNKEV